MQGYFTLFRREMGGYFLSITGYLILASAVFLMGFSFYVLMVKLQQAAVPMPVTEMFYSTQFFWVILLLSAPVITMRLFALEKFSGTYETLMTTQVSDTQVVLAKFSAALLFYAVMWLPLLACLWVVGHFAGQPGSFDPGTVAGTFIGIISLGAVFIALGCCASALTRSQVAAALISLVFGASVFLLAYLADQLPNPDSWHAQALSVFGLFQYMRDFARGVLDTRPLVLFVTLTGFFLFLTLRIVESRRWR